ncbi:hypothetical protein BOX15_Mlig008763g1 [Macrostomum lignano]|uniref:Uncharacterized protein n=1 Tax=Macrostomum lignano TaxID=282301 RepID=A0A267G544_9PLAT|nr:hypothetical protein BOX15_Mlig008763g1 [Macrostomum lignano]
MQQQQQLQTASGRFYLRGRQLSVSVSASPDALTAEVESAGRLWAGEFEAAYLEELTRKTGSYKRFEVFVGMLLSAVGEQQQQQKQKKKKQHQDEAEQLSLDLMTLEDLRALRAQRLGEADSAAAATPRSGAGGDGGKRYLILTYRTRFDQVHYPLALAHQGRVSRAGADRHRQDQRDCVDAALTSSDVDAANEAEQNGNGETARSLAAENAHLRAELALMRRRLTAAEAASAKQKRQADELRAGERLLRLRIRQLTHELALLRRAPPSQSGSRFTSPVGGRRAASRPASAGNSPSPSPRVRDQRNYSYQQQQQQQQQYARYQRRRSPSPRPPQPPAATPRSARQPRSGYVVPLQRELASSARQPPQQQQRRRPRSNSCPRFDPTAYVADVERRRQESRERRRRDIADRIRLAGAPSPPPSVASSTSGRGGVKRRVTVGLEDSFDGGVGSFDDLLDNGDFGDEADSVQLGSFNLSSRRRSRPRQPRSSARKKTPASAAATAVEGYEDDIQQIDERLDRLQSFLNKTLLIH